MVLALPLLLAGCQRAAPTAPNPGTDPQVSPPKVPDSVVVRPPLAIAPFDATQAKAHQEAWARQLGMPAVYKNSIGMELVLLPPGVFQMGSKDGTSAELPRHEVQISKGFYLGRFEVTQEQYEKVMGVNPSSFGPGKVAGVATARFPVESVSWREAQAFCHKLSDKESKVYSCPARRNGSSRAARERKPRTTMVTVPIKKRCR